MTDHVDKTLSLWRSTPFAYGQADCMLSVGDYIASRGGLDVTGLFRGRYTDEAGALDRMAAYGGAMGLVDMTGIERCDCPERGDVVVIDTGSVHVGGLCTGSFVALRLDRGIVEFPMRFVRIVQAWKVK